MLKDIVMYESFLSAVAKEMCEFFGRIYLATHWSQRPVNVLEVFHTPD